MNPDTGTLYTADQVSRLPRPEREKLVMVSGPEASIHKMSATLQRAHKAKVKTANRKKNKAARKSRRKNA